MYEEDKLFGPLTFKQFVALGIGFVISYYAYHNVAVPLAYGIIAVAVVAAVLVAFVRFKPKKVSFENLKQYFEEKKTILPPEEYQKILQKKLAELYSQIEMRRTRGLPDDPKLEEVKAILESLKS